MPYVDFIELKKRISIEQVVGMLGLKVKPEGNQLRGACPACGREGNTRALVITPSAGAFYCHAAQKGGDLINLAAHIREEKLSVAAAWLEAQLGTSTVSTSTVPTSSNAPAPKPNTRGFDRAKYQASLDRSHELLKDIPADLIERADLGVSNKGALKGLVVPLVDKDTGVFITYAEVGYIKLPKATVTPLKRSA